MSLLIGAELKESQLAFFLFWASGLFFFFFFFLSLNQRNVPDLENSSIGRWGLGGGFPTIRECLFVLGGVNTILTVLCLFLIVRFLGGVVNINWRVLHLLFSYVILLVHIVLAFLFTRLKKKQWAQQCDGIKAVGDTFLFSCLAHLLKLIFLSMQYKPTLKKTTPPGSTVAVTSRLPQPSNTGKIAGAKTSTSPTGYTAGNKAQTLSPARKTSNITSPQAGKTDILGPPLRTGRNEQRLYVSDRKTDSAIKRPKGLLPLDKGSLKSRSSTPPGGTLKSTGSSVGANKRKTYSSDNYTSRNDGKGSNGTDYSTPVNGMNMKISDPSGQKPKFCHGCGTKYPVEWAKFCCECGIKRMNL
uniref:Zinc finger C2HC-type containing 1A n=1 Tax=Latimeria chalumnae TaxID=7897 RepID=H3A2B5_LATCH